MTTQFMDRSEGRFSPLTAHNGRGTDGRPLPKLRGSPKQYLKWRNPSLWPVSCGACHQPARNSMQHPSCSDQPATRMGAIFRSLAAPTRDPDNAEFLRALLLLGGALFVLTLVAYLGTT